MNHEAAEGILIEVCKLTKIAPSVLRSRSRIRKIARARQACAYTLRRRTNWSMPQIARFLGLSDHTTIVHAIRVAADLIERDPAFKRMIIELMWAPPAMPLSSQHMGANFAFEVPPPTRMQVKRAVKNLPKPPKPVFERVEADGRHFTMDEDGHCGAGRLAKRNMIAGSRLLAEAILNARVAAR